MIELTLFWISIIIGFLLAEALIYGGLRLYEYYDDQKRLKEWKKEEKEIEEYEQIHGKGSWFRDKRINCKIVCGEPLYYLNNKQSIN